jgi:putative flippase GtrA
MVEAQSHVSTHQPRRGLATLLRCAASSFAGVAVEFTLLTILVSVLHVFYLLGAVAAGAVYFVINFLLNRRWTFRATAGSALPQFLRHAAVTAGGMGLGTAMLWLFVQGLGLPYQVGWAIAGTIAFFSWTYPMHRFFTYAAPAAARPARRPALVIAA